MCYYMLRLLLLFLFNGKDNDLKRKNPEVKIPSSDTIFNYVNCNNIEDILSSFRTINPEIFKMMELEGRVYDVYIDFHDVPFYGV